MLFTTQWTIHTLAPADSGGVARTVRGESDCPPPSPGAEPMRFRGGGGGGGTRPSSLPPGEARDSVEVQPLARPPPPPPTLGLFCEEEEPGAFTPRLFRRPELMGARRRL